VVDILAELAEYGVITLVHDPHADPEETRHEYNLELVDLAPEVTYDAVILAVNHREFVDLDVARLKTLTGNGTGRGVVIDVKALHDRRAVEAAGMMYWSL